MKNEEIIVIIKEDGSMDIETINIAGPSCVDALDAILKNTNAEVIEDKKTSDYYKKAKLSNKNIAVNRR